MTIRNLGSATAALLLGSALLGATIAPSMAQMASGGGSGGGAIQGGNGAPGGGTGVPGSLQNGTSAYGIGETTDPESSMMDPRFMRDPSMQYGNRDNEPASSDDDSE